MLIRKIGRQDAPNRFAETSAPPRIWPATALTDSAVYKKAPQALRALRLLLPPPKDTISNANGRLLITNTVTELAQGAEPPPGSQPIEITPLPKDWVPDPGTW